MYVCVCSTETMGRKYSGLVVSSVVVCSACLLLMAVAAPNLLGDRGRAPAPVEKTTDDNATIAPKATAA